MKPELTPFKQDFFSSDIGFTIEEADGQVDGQHVIAKVRGQFFVPEGESRNKRYYSSALWEKQLARPNIQSYLKEKRMFGTIGHKQPIDDQALLDGKLSHIITDLAVDKNGIPGYGEAYILGTPAGKILNTTLRSGAKLFTSSRALGKFNGVNEKGTPKVDEESYDLKTFDFVIDPGFLQANPQIAEALDKIEDLPENGTGTKPSRNVKPENEGDTNMDHELLKKSMDEAANLRQELNKTTTVANEQKTLVDNQSKQIVALTEQVKQLEGYQALGAPDALKKAQADLKAHNEKMAKFQKDYGTLEEAAKSIDVATKSLTAYKEMGTPEQIKEALTKAKTLLMEYKPLGTPKSIDRVLEKFKGIVHNFKKNEDSKKIKALATEIGVSESSVEKLWPTMKVEEIRKFFKEVREQDDNGNRYRKTTTTAPIRESAAAPGTGSEVAPWKRGDSGSRLMESLSAGVVDMHNAEVNS